MGLFASGDEQLESVKSIIVPWEGVVVWEALPPKSVVVVAGAMGGAEVRAAARGMDYIQEGVPRRLESLRGDKDMQGCGVRAGSFGSRKYSLFRTPRLIVAIILLKSDGPGVVEVLPETEKSFTAIIECFRSSPVYNSGISAARRA